MVPYGFGTIAEPRSTRPSHDEVRQANAVGADCFNPGPVGCSTGSYPSTRTTVRSGYRESQLLRILADQVCTRAAGTALRLDRPRLGIVRIRMHAEPIHTVPAETNRKPAAFLTCEVPPAHWKPFCAAT